jgi:hypothetical protein
MTSRFDWVFIALPQDWATVNHPKCGIADERRVSGSLRNIHD